MEIKINDFLSHFKKMPVKHKNDAGLMYAVMQELLQILKQMYGGVIRKGITLGVLRTTDDVF